jgi:coenzyme F420 hydrogenase subunit beta
MAHGTFNGETIPELHRGWGPVLEVWEGYATDSEIRFKGSSGGIATALALFCLDEEVAQTVLQTRDKEGAPLENAPVLSRDKESLMASTGSRYSPAAPCEKLDTIREADSPSVVTGKPCDIVALRKAETEDEQLRENVALSISIFCAGTPSRAGTKRILETLSVKPEDVEQIRYRGLGWPGMTAVETKGEEDRVAEMTYDQSWGEILSKHVQFRCRLCPDSTGEFADISCGDPWYRQIDGDEPGRSLVLVRTERGRRILKMAREAGYVTLERAGSDVLARSQQALLKRRKHLWGRLLAMRIMRIPVPQFKGFSLYANWRELPLFGKVRSVGGTFKRILQRGLRKPLVEHRQ